MLRLALLLGCSALLTTTLATADSAPVASVQSQILGLHRMSTQVEAYGILSISPAAITHMTTLVPGQVTALYVQRGQRVTKGQKLLDLKLDPSVMQSYVQAKNQWVLARQDLAHQQQLLAAQLTTQSAVDAATHALHNAELAVHTLKDEGADQGTMTLVAPRSALVTGLSLNPGDHVGANSSLLALGVDEKLQAILQVDPDDASRLTTGMPVRLGDVFAAVDRGVGQVENVGHTVDPVTRHVEVLVRLKETPLLEGTPVRAHITVSSENHLAVPRASILQDIQGSFIYRISNGHAHRVNINTGHESAGWVEVSGDLTPGQHIVVLGNYELQDGMGVREDVLP
ncbi:MAG: efflux RND transporter periplasmic adaptor subunit [Pseudomonadales bacterium]|nr:efflux RND transporter periplasmic adaptor subunit [Pseudomonadales bacterium]